jgi:hypothetical protein
VASVEPLPGSDRPSASVRQFIELAVNMPEQEPQVGQAERSMTLTSRRRSCRRRRHHGVDQVERLLLAVHDDLAGLHRAARDEHGRDVEPQRRHQHAGRDLVAVGDADHGVGAVRVDHVLDRVGDDLARRQRIEHAVMAHGDAVVDRDGVEFLGDAAGRLDLARHQLAESFRCTWPGTNWVKELTTAMIGLPKSPSFMPVARQRPRAPAMLRPWVVVRER